MPIKKQTLTTDSASFSRAQDEKSTPVEEDEAVLAAAVVVVLRNEAAVEATDDTDQTLSLTICKINYCQPI